MPRVNALNIYNIKFIKGENMDGYAIWESLFQFTLANPLVQATLLGLFRGLAGWVQHAAEDGEIDMPEIKELIATVLRVLPQGVGLAAFGIPPVGALFSDVFVTKFAKMGKK